MKNYAIEVYNTQAERLGQPFYEKETWFAHFRFKGFDQIAYGKTKREAYDNAVRFIKSDGTAMDSVTPYESPIK